MARGRPRRRGNFELPGEKEKSTVWRDGVCVVNGVEENIKQQGLNFFHVRGTAKGPPCAVTVRVCFVENGREYVRKITWVFGSLIPAVLALLF